VYFTHSIPYGTCNESRPRPLNRNGEEERKDSAAGRKGAALSPVRLADSTTAGYRRNTPLERISGLNNPLITSISGRLFKNDEMQDARILWKEAYIKYAAMTKDEAQHSKSRFSGAC